MPAGLAMGAGAPSCPMGMSPFQPGARPGRGRTVWGKSWNFMRDSAGWPEGVTELVADGPQRGGRPRDHVILKRLRSPFSRCILPALSEDGSTRRGGARIDGSHAEGRREAAGGKGNRGR